MRRSSVPEMLSRSVSGCGQVLLVAMPRHAKQWNVTPILSGRVSRLPAGALVTQPLRIDITFYCYKCDGMATGKTCPHGDQDRLSISGTRLREMFANHEEVSAKFSRPEVLKVLQAYYDTLK